MQNHPGVFIVLEGSDGSGKGTQFRLLTERLKAVGHEVAVFDFPRYHQPSSHFVKRYLNGDYGPAREVSPYIASIFFALDRYEAAPEIKEALVDGKVVLANRYVGSNMAHQATAFGSFGEQRGFFMWAEHLEYQLLGAPRPNINLFLKVPAEISFELIAKKAERSYTKRTRDELEADIEHLKKAVAAYALLCKLFPKDFKEINCTRDGQIRTIVEINDRIWAAIKPLLPEPKRKGKGAVISLNQSEDTADIKTETKQTKSEPKQAKDAQTWFDGILTLKKQMLRRSDLLKGENRRQLEAAINLLTPLKYRKSEVKELLNEPVATKLSADDEPVTVNEIIEQLPWSIPTTSSDEQIKLLAANPWNEFQLLDEAESTNLNYRQKEQALTSKLKNVVSRVNYHFEATGDWATLLAFKNEISLRDIKISVTSPRLGYTVPEIVEAAGLEEPFNKAFELSAELYGQMTADSGKNAIYVLLLGHNVRWKFGVDASTLSKALKSSKNQDLQSFLDLLRQKIAEHHPHVARILESGQSTATHEEHKKRR